MKTHTTLIAAAVVLSILILGCSKKREIAEELQEPMSMTSLANMTAEPSVKAQIPGVPLQPPAKDAAAPIASSGPEAPAQATSSTLEALPPPGPYNPSVLEVQTALKNAGLYTGAVDGKAGPLTKKAIEEFQKAHNLKVDGKVGPQTWGLLCKELTPETPAPVAKKKK